MIFKFGFTIDVEDAEVLRVVNDYQDIEEVEGFDSLEDVPKELIFLALENCDYFEDDFYDLSYEEMDIDIVKG